MVVWMRSFITYNQILIQFMDTEINIITCTHYRYRSVWVFNRSLVNLDTRSAREEIIADKNPRRRRPHSFPGLTTNAVKYLGPESPWFVHGKEDIHRHSEGQDRECSQGGNRFLHYG